MARPKLTPPDGGYRPPMDRKARHESIDQAEAAGLRAVVRGSIELAATALTEGAVARRLEGGAVIVDADAWALIEGELLGLWDLVRDKPAWNPSSRLRAGV